LTTIEHSGVYSLSGDDRLKVLTVIEWQMRTHPVLATDGSSWKILDAAMARVGIMAQYIL